MKIGLLKILNQENLDYQWKPDNFKKTFHYHFIYDDLHYLLFMRVYIIF